jgi:hypothetical protein
VQEVAALAGEGRFDYLVIESTGVGEPMQVRWFGACRCRLEALPTAGPTGYRGDRMPSRKATLRPLAVLITVGLQKILRSLDCYAEFDPGLLR